MVQHEEFLRLCAAATAGELTQEEQAKLDAHLASCLECRKALSEYAAVARRAGATLASEFSQREAESDSQWSIEEAEKRFRRRVEVEQGSSSTAGDDNRLAKSGQRFRYRPSQLGWREVWMSLAAVVLLSIALAVTTYRTGVKRGTDVARVSPPTANSSDNSLEAQVSDAGYERSQLMAKLTENAKTIDELKRQLARQAKVVESLTRQKGGPAATGNGEHPIEDATRPNSRDAQLAAAQTKLGELQTTVDQAMAQRDENARQAAVLEARVNDLTELVKERELAIDRTEAEVAKGKELLEHDRDIRDLMGARDLYIADVHDVGRKGTEKTYGRVFYTKGKRLIFYAFDLDAQPGVQNASAFQAWGRRGPDKQQARSLGIFYEDNASKKRWVLKAEDPKSLEDIDAVFVTVEPHGGSQYPSGKPLLFAYLRINPNHP